MVSAAKLQKRAYTAEQQTAEQEALTHDGVLPRILQLVGAGQHLFVTSISQRASRHFTGSFLRPRTERTVSSC